MLVISGILVWRMSVYSLASMCTVLLRVLCSMYHLALLHDQFLYLYHMLTFPPLFRNLRSLYYLALLHDQSLYLCHMTYLSFMLSA